MRPYTLKAGEGWTCWYGIDFAVKAGELHPGRGAPFIEYTTRKREGPPDHSHPTEDEIFYVLNGELTFRYGGESFNVGDGGFIAGVERQGQLVARPQNRSDSEEGDRP